MPTYTTEYSPQGMDGLETRYHRGFADPVGYYLITPVQTRYTWQNIKTSTDNPKWKEQVRRSENATTHFVRETQKYYHVNGSGETLYVNAAGKHHLRAFTGQPQGFPTGPLSDPFLLDASWVDLRARENFLKHYRERRTAFQGGVFLGELMETVRMLKRPVSALRNGIDDYYAVVKKRLKWSKRQQWRLRRHSVKIRNKRIIQDTWLEFAYGWKPLVGDAEDAIKLLSASDEKYKQYCTGEQINNLTATFVDRQHAVPSGFRMNYTVKQTGYSKCKYKGAACATITPPTFSEQMGLSWSNVLPTVWELIPYSFLVDYFTNVGKIIEGVSTGQVNLAWGCKTIDKIYESEISRSSWDEAIAELFKPSGTVSYSGYATIAGKVQSRRYDVRDPVSSVSIGIGDFYFKTPGSNLKWLNIAALARLKR
jgi:hypothetical protein